MQQEVLHRRCGEHDAQLEQLIGKPRGKRHTRTLLQQHDRAHRIGEGLFLFRGHLADAARRIGVCHHDGKRLAAAMLPLAQSRDRRGIARVAHQVEPAKPLHGHDLPRAKELDYPRNESI